MSRQFSIAFDARFVKDLKEARAWYDQQTEGLGEKFYKAVAESLIIIKRNPLFQIRYDDVRCYAVKKYPYLIHFTVDETEMKIIVRAIIHTSRNTNLQG